MNYFDINTTPLDGVTYSEDGVGRVPETDVRVANWFEAVPKNCLREFTTDGYPILLKYKLDNDGVFYTHYSTDVDADGAILPDMVKVQAYIDGIEQKKTNQEAMEYLVSTDWMSFRGSEGGKPMSQEIKQLRAEARLKVVGNV
mgnify:CR=1 FL=1